MPDVDGRSEPMTLMLRLTNLSRISSLAGRSEVFHIGWERYVAIRDVGMLIGENNTSCWLIGMDDDVEKSGTRKAVH